jgi:hypothetical protein
MLVTIPFQPRSRSLINRRKRRVDIHNSFEDIPPCAFAEVEEADYYEVGVGDLRHKELAMRTGQAVRVVWGELKHDGREQQGEGWEEVDELDGCEIKRGRKWYKKGVECREGDGESGQGWYSERRGGA